MELYPMLSEYISDLQTGYKSIPDDRKQTLSRLAEYIRTNSVDDNPVALNFICTHNSRRSQIAQIWCATAAAYYDLTSISAFSGGTEATAFHPNAVKAMERAGFHVEANKGSNPIYSLKFSEGGSPITCFSKVYDDEFNPSSHFTAIMTCSDADENCPFVPGASFRLRMTYADPKIADGTAAEAATYDDRVKQIGTEIFFALSQVAHP